MRHFQQIYWLNYKYLTAATHGFGGAYILSNCTIMAIYYGQEYQSKTVHAAWFIKYAVGNVKIYFFKYRANKA